MSLILDALNRSRGTDGQVPDLATEHFTEEQDGGGDWRRYLPWVALLLALLVIGWLLLQRDNPPVAPQSLPSPPIAGDQTVPAAVGRPEPRDLPRPPDPLPQPVESPPALPVEESLRAAQAPASVDAAEPADAPDPAVADLYRQSEPRPTADTGTRERGAEPGQATPAEAPAAGVQVAAVPAEPPQEEPIDIEKMVLEAREELENANLDEHAAPFIAELSQQTKDSIPTIFYERHDYSGNPAQSNVVLNGKKLKVGGSAAAGVKVEEILSDSVVLSHRGTQFRLRALNSWINL